MGGKALKEIPKGKETRRYQKDEFRSLSNILLPKVRDVFKTKAELVESYKNKESFGDMDILVLNNGFNIDIPFDSDFATEVKKIIQKEFEPNQIHRTKNSNVYSFDYNRLQIDLILTEDKEWESSNIFYMWGDLGNFMGKLFSSYGNLSSHGYLLKYGYDGIKVNFNSKKNKLFLSRDNKKVFEFLGLDFEKFKEGFESKEEVFAYIMTSKFYNYNIFQWDNLNHVNKSRNKKRKDYYLFLEYIEENDKSTSIIEYNETKDYYLNELKEFFGVDLKKEHKVIQDRIKLNKKVSSKFNGHHILGDFKINPNRIYQLVTTFKKSIESEYESYNDFILSNDLDVILEKFKQINEL